MVEGALGRRSHGGRGRRAEVDAHDHRIRGLRSGTCKRIFAARDVGSITTRVASRTVEAKDDSLLRGRRRLVDRREDDDRVRRELREGGVGWICGPPVTVRGASCHPCRRLLWRCVARSRAIGGVERAIGSRPPAGQGPETQWLRPRRKRERDNRLDHASQSRRRALFVRRARRRGTLLVSRPM